MKKFGPQEYLSLLLLFVSLFTWIVSSIFKLDAANGNTEKSLMQIESSIQSIDETSRAMQVDLAQIKGKLNK